MRWNIVFQIQVSRDSVLKEQSLSELLNSLSLAS